MNAERIITALNKKKRNENKISDTHSIGTIARKRRQELRLTLEQVADKICSVSYLSKVEANKIVPNPSCVQLLMEKMDMPMYERYLLENEDESLRESLNYFYTLDIENYEDLYNRVFEVKNCIADIICIGYFILKEEYQKCKSLVESVNKMLGALSDTALDIFALYATHYYLYTFDYVSANALIDKLENEIVNDTFKVLVREISFRAHVFECRHTFIYKEFEELNSYYSKCEHFKKIKTIKLLYLQSLFDACEYQELTKVGNSPLFASLYETNDLFNYLMGVSYVRQNETIAAKGYLDQVNESSIYFKKCLEEKYLIDIEDDKLIDIVKDLNKEKPDFYFEYFIRSKTICTNKKDLFMTDLFAKALSNASVSEKVKLYKLYIEALKESVRYKEATIISEKIDALLSLAKSYR